MKNTMRFIGAIAVVVAMAGCASLKPFSADEIRQIGFSVPTEQKAAK